MSKIKSLLLEEFEKINQQLPIDEPIDMVQLQEIRSLMDKAYVRWRRIYDYIKLTERVQQSRQEFKEGKGNVYTVEEFINEIIKKDK